jgi:hypothetical protein
MVLFIFVNCASPFFQVKQAKQDAILIESASEECQSKEFFHQWYFLFGYYKIYGKTGNDLFTNHDPKNSYKIHHKAYWWDIAISIFGPILITVNKKTTIVETCYDKTLVFASKEDYQNYLVLQKEMIRQEEEFKYETEKTELQKKYEMQSEKEIEKWEINFLKEREERNKEFEELVSKNKERHYAIFILKSGEIKKGKILSIDRDTITIDVEKSKETYSKYNMGRIKIYK